MNQIAPLNLDSSPVPAVDPVIVVGAGPAGTRAAQELSRLGLGVVLINAERWRPYNRVKLTPLLSGEAQIGQVYVSEAFPGPGRVARYDGVAVVDIVPEDKRILLSNGRRMTYSRLVLATGSRAFVPKIPGADLPGVFVFRNFDDTERLIARSMSARKVVVIGGGLLGLEAARGLNSRGAAVTVIEHEDRLMPRQLDQDASATLAARIIKLGVDIVTGKRVASIDGQSRIETVTLASGEVLAADTVIVCTGVRANTQLAAAIGIRHSRGILVDDRMRTSQPDIFAIGECAEHDGVIHGLVGPGFEQALVAARVIAGEDVAYTGSVPATKLKVLGAEVFSIGDFESVSQQPYVNSYHHRDPQTGAYRRIFVARSRLVAALGVGDWPEATRLQQAVGRRATVLPWQVGRFQRTGALWKAAEDTVASWPAQAIVCNCTGTTKGAIADAVTLGAATLDDVRVATGANTVCGTCQPLVLELLGGGSGAAPEPARWWRWLVGLSLAAAVLVVATLALPRIPLADSFRSGDLLRALWFDSLFKQWSGYTLLGLSAAAALLGLRKRIGFLKGLGGYNGWRLVHLGIGLAAALALVWHTGFRLGANLNLVLMLSFAATLVFGAVAGFVTGGEHELRARDLVDTRNPRSLPAWLHILALWPLPVLLVIHILTVYTY